MPVVASSELFDWTCQYIGNHLATRAIPARLNNDPQFDPSAAARICEMMFQFCDGQLHSYQKAVDDFVDYSLDFIKLQAELERSGKYHFESYAALCDEVLHNPDVMERSYLNGLFLSQALWINHHKVLRFFGSDFCHLNQETGTVLEVPVGTGIYIAEFVRRNPLWTSQAFDLSSSSVKFSRKMIPIAAPGSKVEVMQSSVFDLPGDIRYDRVICGQLLENLEDPRSLLEQLQRLLSPQGRLFLTSSVWASVIDHIYLFTRTQELRDMLQAYFVIEDEYVLNVDEHKGPEDEKTPINYAAVLRHLT